VRLLDVDDRTLATIDHDLCRVRRSTLNPLFSKANVRKLEYIIESGAPKGLSRTEKLENTNQPLTIFYLLSAFARDVIL